jgi:hypothetical protein
VYPWEVAYVPANGLSWANRPLPASFNSYTARLDSLNAAFFDSSRRPEFLLWHTDPLANTPLWSIDRRYVLWDEPRTLRAILGGYDFAGQQPGLFLLRSRPRPRFGQPEPVERHTIAWGKWVNVPADSGILLAHATIEPSMRTRVIRTLFRESAVFVSLRFSSGEEATFRIVPASAASGFWVSPFAGTVEELPNLLMRGDGRRVAAIRFETARAAGFYEPVVVTWSRLPLADGTWSGTGRLLAPRAALARSDVTRFDAISPFARRSSNFQPFGRPGLVEYQVVAEVGNDVTREESSRFKAPPSGAIVQTIVAEQSLSTVRGTSAAGRLDPPE